MQWSCKDLHNDVSDFAQQLTDSQTSLTICLEIGLTSSVRGPKPCFYSCKYPPYLPHSLFLAPVPKYMNVLRCPFVLSNQLMADLLLSKCLPSQKWILTVVWWGSGHCLQFQNRGLYIVRLLKALTSRVHDVLSSVINYRVVCCMLAACRNVSCFHIGAKLSFCHGY